MVASICAIAVTLALMSLADAGTIGPAPERVFDFGAGPGADHQGDGNAMFPGASGRRPAAFTDVTPVTAGVIDAPKLVVLRVDDTTSTTTTSTTVPLPPPSAPTMFSKPKTSKTLTTNKTTSTRRTQTASRQKRRVRVRYHRPAPVRRIEVPPRRHGSGSCRFN